MEVRVVVWFVDRERLGGGTRESVWGFGNVLFLDQVGGFISDKS